MSILTEAAEQARLAREAAEEAAKDAARKELRQEALDAVRAALVREDGTTMTLAEAGLEGVESDLQRGVVVLTDGAATLGAHRRGEADWVVHLVRRVDDAWVRVSGPLSSLADLGVALRVAD